jgi:hypothetical protein
MAEFRSRSRVGGSCAADSLCSSFSLCGESAVGGVLCAAQEAHLDARRPARWSRARVEAPRSLDSMSVAVLCLGALALTNSAGPRRIAGARVPLYFSALPSGRWPSCSGALDRDYATHAPHCLGCRALPETVLFLTCSMLSPQFHHAAGARSVAAEVLEMMCAHGSSVLVIRERVDVVALRRRRNSIARHVVELRLRSIAFRAIPAWYARISARSFAE